MGFWSKLGKAALVGTIGGLTGGVGAGVLAGGMSLLGGGGGGGGRPKNPYQSQIDDTLKGDKERADTAYGDYTKSRDEYKGAIDRTESFDPTETRGLKSAQASFVPTRTDNAKSSVADYNPVNVQGLDPSTIAALKASNTAGVNVGETFAQSGKGPGAGQGMVDTSALRGFDPQQAINTWASGAWGQTQQGLTERLREMRQDAAGRHRLNTGWFDEDTGRVVRDTTNNFQSELAKQAVNAAGIYVDAQGRAVNAEVARMGDMDKFALDASQQGLTRAKYMSDAELERAKYLDTFSHDTTLEAYDRGAKRAEYLDDADLSKRKGVDDFTKWQAETGDTLGLKAAAGTDDFNLQRGKFIDSSRQDAIASGMKARGDLYTRESEMYGGATDRYHDWLAGASDRWQGKQNADDQNRRNWWQTGLDAVGTLGGFIRDMRRPSTGGGVYTDPTWT